MAATIIWSNKEEHEAEKWWDDRKKELVEGINTTLTSGSDNREVLELMLDLVKNARIRSSISTFYDEIEGQGGK